MKKIKILLLVFVCVLALTIVLQQCDHEDTITFVKADAAEVTFEELLAPPYAAEGIWSFVDTWRLECNGQYLDDVTGKEDLYIALADGLREVLQGETLHAYLPDVKDRAYDKHVKDLLWDQEDIPLFFQISAGILPTVRDNDTDVIPTMVNLYSLDGKRCYLTIGYRNNIEITGTYYVYYTDDPELVEALFSFAEQMVQEKTDL